MHRDIVSIFCLIACRIILISFSSLQLSKLLMWTIKSRLTVNGILLFYKSKMIRHNIIRIHLYFFKTLVGGTMSLITKLKGEHR